MATCYNCGKLLLMKKVFGQVGSGVFTFCSEKCRTATWNKIGVQDANSTEIRSNGIDLERKSTSSVFEKNIQVRKSGSPSNIVISGAEYVYSAKTDRITMKIASLMNKSESGTGKLRIELFLSKSGPYQKDKKLTGATVAISNEYESLKKNYNYTNITSTVLKCTQVKPGTYFPILFVKELNEDGTWKIAGFANFSNSIKWN